MRAGRRAAMPTLCLLGLPVLAVSLPGPMLELGCARTHSGAPCATWGDTAGAPPNASCAAHPGEPLPWCWTNERHTAWQFCDRGCHVNAKTAVAQFDLRDPQMFPSLNSALLHLHRQAPDIDAAIKLLSSAVAAARTDVQEHPDHGDALDAASRRAVVEYAHASFLLATLTTELMDHATSDALLRGSCPLLQDLYGDAQDADPTAFSSSCYEFWTHSLEERGDIHTARDVTRLARDSTFRAEFHDRLENWEEAMTVVKRFARSRTADRRDGTAFQRYRKRMPSAGPGFTEEVRLYSLELLKKASVSDAVGAVQGEVDRVERLYRESGVKQPGDDGACDAAHSDDERKVVSLADRLAVARTLLRHLPASPQVTSRGNFATWGSEGHVMVAALCVAIVVVICWVFQQRWRRATCRCSNLTSRAFGFKADRRWSSATGRCEVVSKQPDLRSEVETARSVAGEQKSQRQQRRRRKTKAATPVPNLDAAKATVEIPQSKGAVHTRDSTAGHLKPRKTTQPRQTVQAKPASTPVARNAAAQKETKSRRPVTNKVAATEAAPVSISKSTPPAETKATRDNCMVERVASIVSTDGARIADIRITDAKPLRCPAELRHQQSEDHCAQLDAEPEQEQHAQNARVEQCVPQAHEVNSAVSEDLRAIAGRKRQLSQPVSDVSEISSVDGDTVSSAGSDAGSVSSRSGSVYAPISPSYVLHHPQLQLRSQQEQSMSWAQKLRSGMAARASAPPGMDTSDSDTNSISSLEDSYSFRSEAACRRRLSTVCSVNNTDGEEIADEASPDSHAMQHERERFGSSSAADSDGGGRRGRARSRAMRPACSSSDSESDQDLGARRARTSMPPLLSRDGAHPQCVKKVAAGPGPASTCHCIDEVWDGRLPEGVMAEKLSAADGGVLGRSAALGTIPFELQQPARHYLGVRPYRSWDASGGSTLSSVMESEAPGQLHERGSDAGDRGAASAPTPAASTTTRVLTRAWSVDTSNSAGIHRRQTDRSERSAVPPVVAPLPFGLRRDSAASSAPVTPSGCPSPILGTQSGSDSPRVDKANTVRSDSEGTGTNSVEPLKSSAGLGSSTTGATAGRAGPAAMAEMMRKADDSSSGDRPAIAHRAPAHHQAVPVPVPVPVHVQMWPTAPQPLHSMQTFADHIDASNAALVAVAEQRLACRHAIEQQILFYFSAENMSRDTYLRSNMDKDGYVSLALIAGFRRIAALTNDASLVMEAVLANPGALEMRMGQPSNGSAGVEERQQGEASVSAAALAQQPVIRATDPAIRRLRNELEGS